MTGKRPSIRSRASKPSSTVPTRPRTSYVTKNETISSTKKDKRTIKHSALISRIEKANKKTQKRRRPSKKLVANLQALTDALPDLGSLGGAETETGNARIGLKGLKSRPGAMKRKEKLEKMERERFEKNMAQMVELKSAEATRSAAAAGNEAGSGTGSRWAALRGFIQQTMEQRPDAKTA